MRAPLLARLACAVLLVRAAHALHIVLAPLPSEASLAPFLGVAVELADRGHCLTIAAPAPWHAALANLSASASARLLVVDSPLLTSIDRRTPAHVRAAVATSGAAVSSALSADLNAHTLHALVERVSYTPTAAFPCAPRIDVALIDFDLLPSLVAPLDAARIPVTALGTAPLDADVAFAVDWADVVAPFDAEASDGVETYGASLLARLARPPRRWWARARELAAATMASTPAAAWSGALANGRTLFFPSVAGVDVPRPLPPHIMLSGALSPLGAALATPSPLLDALVAPPARAVHAAFLRSWLAAAVVRQHTIVHLHLGCISSASHTALRRALDLVAHAPHSTFVMRKKPQPHPTAYRVLWTLRSGERDDCAAVLPHLAARGLEATPIGVAATADEHNSASLWYRIDATGTVTGDDDNDNDGNNVTAAINRHADAFVLLRIVSSARSVRAADSAWSVHAAVLSAPHARALYPALEQRVHALSVADVPRALVAVAASNSAPLTALEFEAHARDTHTVVAVGACGGGDAHAVWDALALGTAVVCMDELDNDAVDVHDAAPAAAVVRRLERAGVGCAWSHAAAEHPHALPRADAYVDVLACALALSADALNTVRSLVALAGGARTVAARVEHVGAFTAAHTVPWEWRRGGGLRRWLESIVFGFDFAFVWVLVWCVLVVRVCVPCCVRCCCCCCGGGRRRTHVDVVAAAGTNKSKTE